MAGIGNKKTPSGGDGARKRAMGFEPTTSSLGSWHSTTELRPQDCADVISARTWGQADALRAWLHQWAAPAAGFVFVVVFSEYTPAALHAAVCLEFDPQLCSGWQGTRSR